MIGEIGGRTDRTILALTLSLVIWPLTTDLASPPTSPEKSAQEELVKLEHLLELERQRFKQDRERDRYLAPMFSEQDCWVVQHMVPGFNCEEIFRAVRTPSHPKTEPEDSR